MVDMIDADKRRSGRQRPDKKLTLPACSKQLTEKMASSRIKANRCRIWSAAIWTEDIVNSRRPGEVYPQRRDVLSLNFSRRRQDPASAKGNLLSI